MTWSDESLVAALIINMSGWRGCLGLRIYSKVARTLFAAANFLHGKGVGSEGFRRSLSFDMELGPSLFTKALKIESKHLNSTVLDI